MADRVIRTVEEQRLAENYAGGKTLWHRWGPYLSERQWGTVREDYSADGSAWDYFPHDHSRSRAYRWGEDGIAGICDRRGLLCFALAFWNGKDPILKERLFGLTNAQGNHGEDVKEIYHYLDNTPTHSYMKYLYKYPQRAYPYADLVRENHHRTAHDPEYEIFHTDAFAENRYFDIFIEYAKASPDDISIQITAINRGPETAPLWLLPTLWYRNDWTWKPNVEKPMIYAENGEIHTKHPQYGLMNLLFEGDAELLFTENETNLQRLYGKQNRTPFVKDAFHNFVVEGETEAVNPDQSGTKVTPMRRFDIPAGGQIVYKLHLTTQNNADARSAENSRFRRDFRQPLCPETGGSGRILSLSQPRSFSRAARGATSGVRRVALEQTALRLRYPRLDARRPKLTDPTEISLGRAQCELATLLLLRSPFHAGQVGISLVCRMGYGIPYYFPRPH